MAYRNTVHSRTLEGIIDHYIASRSRGTEVKVIVRFGLVTLQEDPDHPDKLCAFGPVDAPWPRETEAPDLLTLIGQIPDIDAHLASIRDFLSLERADELILALTRGQLCFVKKSGAPGIISVSVRGILPTLQEHRDESPQIVFENADVPESEWDGNFDDVLHA